jgi:hypothetical protein
MSIITAFNKAYEKKEKRGWDHIYVFVDVHETIFKPTYESGQKEFEYYKDAKKALKMVSNRKDIILGLSTCSYPDQIGRFLDKLESDGIHFDLINENPMEKNTSYANFDQKPYFNVLIEDKAGFEPDFEWHLVFKCVQKRYLIDMTRDSEELGLYDDYDGYYKE